ncbi:MAG: hypothetical protein FGM50_10200 [Mycobacterium sp.]|nr:hypothetical protein [Mycobacterium sp.]
MLSTATVPNLGAPGRPAVGTEKISRSPSGSAALNPIAALGTPAVRSTSICIGLAVGVALKPNRRTGAGSRLPLHHG